ncbi:hypothetical protein JOB18_029169 [Solea senegalensis]|uniref:Secreted protein n=1 Tax=Solea senegalensis TaxID=28829 RepID=A0AAV6SGY5_SOLSE|nr:hypothetical protein JOB18_029169 [Solea senegalensis]
MCVCVRVCVNLSVSHTTEQWSPKQSADISPGVCRPPGRRHVWVYINAHSHRFCRPFSATLRHTAHQFWVLLKE